MYHLQPLVSLQVHLFKIKMQMYKLLFVLKLSRSFSQLLYKEKFCRRFVYFEDTVTYFDKIIMFSHRREANRYIEVYPAIIVLK